MRKMETRGRKIEGKKVELGKEIEGERSMESRK